MSNSLPERPNLDQLRRQSKELRDSARSGDAAALERFARQNLTASPGAVSLVAAQLVIARELGFSSWPRLKGSVEAAAAASASVDELVDASVDGPLRTARAIFRGNPDLARENLLAATVLGEAEVVRERLAVDPAAGVAIDDRRGWPLLLYACYSRWHQIDPARTAGLAEVVRLLLEVGASPNTNNGARPHRGYRSALHGSASVNNPAIMRLLLGRGADPTDGESLYHAAGHRDHACLELLLSHGAAVGGTWALDVAVHADDPEGVAMLLRTAERRGEPVNELATSLLADAAATASIDVIGALVRAGGDPQARDDAGISAVRLAVRAGRPEAATLLLAVGAPDDTTDIDSFIGTCTRADRTMAEQLLARHPDLRERLTDNDRAAIVEAAGSGTAAAVALMLDLGFGPDARNSLGEQPLHTAAYAGNAEAVRLLLDAGADIDARDDNFDGTPLGYATVGSGEHAGQPGDWIETVRMLVEAGASRNGVWISAKPPSEEVIDLLRSYGVTPDDEPQLEPVDDSQPPALGAGVMAEIAQHLEAAYRDRDLELLGSLLHPQVRWTGVCQNRAQVIDWYRGLVAEGTLATVESVEVDRDAAILGLSVGRQAQGARQSPPQWLYQVFRVENEQVVEILAYPDRSSALART